MKIKVQFSGVNSVCTASLEESALAGCVIFEFSLFGFNGGFHVRKVLAA